MYILSLPKYAEQAMILSKYDGKEIEVDEKLDDDLFRVIISSDDPDEDSICEAIPGSWFKKVEDKKETNKKRALVFDGDEWSVIGELDDRDRDIIANIIGTVPSTTWKQINLHIGILTRLVEEDD